jgi:hypothetical protein
MRGRRLCLWAATSLAVSVFGQTPAPSKAPAATKEVPAARKNWTPPQTPDGQPDLSGYWTNITLTPLQRPANLAGKAFFTPAEAAAYEKETVDRNNADRRDPGTDADVGKAYNDFWWDRGTKVVSTLRTSLIVDPADGKVPALTPQAQRLLTERTEHLD